MAGDEDLRVKNAVARKLEAMGVGGADMDARTAGQLEKIERALQAEEAELAKARATIRGRGFALSAVSAASGVSRATFYNKPLLAEYIELSKAEAVGDAGATAPKAELEEARERVRLLMERDGELVLALADNERLSKRVEALEAALEDSRSHFEGMPKGRVVHFEAAVGKEER